MAIVIDRLTGIISVPQSDLALLSGTLYSADTNAIRNAIKEIEASEEGIVWDDTHQHNTTVDLFGVTYARTIEYLNPASITFTPDTQWSVRLEGSNNNMGDIEAGILNQNQVQVIPTNSAGLIDLEILTSSAFQGQCVVSPTRGQTGTTKPIGTFERPSDNMVDALSIAVREGLPKFLMTEDITLNEDFSLGYSFLCSSPNNVVTIQSGANVTGCNFTNLTLNGELDGLNLVRDCSLQAVTALSGFVEKTAFQSTVSTAGDVFIAECYSQVAGTGYPVFTTGVDNLIFRDYHGSLGISGMTGGIHTVEMYGGKLNLDATCTGGTIYLRGNYTEAPINLGTTLIVDQTENEAISTAVWGRVVNGTVSGSFGEILRTLSFQGHIHIDTTAGSAGTAYPLGTHTHPVNSIADAVTIGLAEGIDVIQVDEDVTIGATDNVDGFQIIGAHATKSEFTLVAGCSTNLTQFTNCQLTGTADGQIVVRDSFVNELGGFGGVLFNCALSGAITPANLAGHQHTLILSCYANAAEVTEAAIIDYVNSPDDVVISDWFGPIKFVNKTTAVNTAIAFSTANVTIEATCTAGTFYVGGTGGVFTDNSAGSSVFPIGVFNNDTASDAVWDELIAGHSIADTFGKRIPELLTQDDFIALN